VSVPNVTLSINEQLLERGRSYAAARKSSLNALIRNLLERELGRGDAAVDSYIATLQEASGKSGGKTISREDLHRY
jgi:hypothetical protein